MNISEEELNSLIEDEKKGFITYSKLGLDNIARDEKKHHEFLKKLRKQSYGY
jgi:hypothetical protein